MEKIKVNMSPNPLDVQTIHASQNDGEAREWEFELHNNGELIDTSDVTEQMMFKAYKGGTEQILPENGSTPTTSPFKGDIKYPQGLLTDQEFTYRQSPTEEDGLAKITDIKGNTLNWNQLVQNGNFADSSNWYARQSTFTVSDNIATVTPSTEGTERGMYNLAFPVKANHKYLLSCEIKPPIQSTARVSFGGSINYGFDVIIQANQWSKCQGIVLNDTDRNIGFYSLIRNSLTPSQTIQFRNMMVIDLTQMGLDITEPSEFTSLFPLSYYAYNQGSLLSFNGNGIKTVGKNLLPLNLDDIKSFNTVGSWIGNVYSQNGITLTINEQNGIIQDIVANGRASAEVRFKLCDFQFDGIHDYWLSGCPSGGSGSTYRLYIASQKGGVANWMSEFGNGLVGIGYPKQTASTFIYINSGSSLNNLSFKPFVCFNSLQNKEYEPYTSSTLSLPISTYFPTGMKSAGNVYDELTESKAITRVGEVDVPISSSSWVIHGTDRFYLNGWLPNNIATDKNANLENNKGLAVQDLSNEYGSYMWFGYNGLYLNRISSTETIAEMQTRLSGLKLYYELATPTETSFTTASLVTENAEIPLSNDDGVLIGKCTEQLSENPGFIDAKIKLADSDGECYSNKIQLHVERSPQ